jgi:hypothetical protein
VFFSPHLDWNERGHMLRLDSEMFLHSPFNRKSSSFRVTGVPSPLLGDPLTHGAAEGRLEQWRREGKPVTQGMLRSELSNAIIKGQQMNDFHGGSSKHA